MDAITRDLQKPVPRTFLYADDVILACEDKGELERQVQAWCDHLEMFGLRLNVKKTEYLTTDVNEFGSIKINGTERARTSVLKHLGPATASDGSLMVEVNSRVSAACPSEPVAMYGAECWPATKEAETRLSVMETKMLRWMAGVTRLDRIRNEAIRQKFGVAPIADKMREARHVLRGEEDSVHKLGLNFEVPGKRPRGRPKQRWADTSQELYVAGVHTDLARDRERWQHGIRKADSDKR
ncbi:unnamed protein product [Heligmosomoides polygyrus]|uniref:Reverse transcriptase domain-containing protein n=1 Tax=Heligmosomoides polygyrus TaxID=6339 RepID=A0A183G8Y1_HELPZ|nr:unnamed protein product [Heligmosomoides polygyrus]